MKVIIGSHNDVPIVVEHDHPGAVLQRQDAERRRAERERKRVEADTLKVEPLVGN